jgi:hypothetical protein
MPFQFIIQGQNIQTVGFLNFCMDLFLNNDYYNLRLQCHRLICLDRMEIKHYN